MRGPAELRVFSRLVQSGDCWLWTLTPKRGYGVVRDDQGKVVQVHRWVWEFFNGPIPEGLTLDHLIESGVCTSKLCVNPDHLDPVPQSINAQRARRKPLCVAENHPRYPRTGKCIPCVAEQNRIHNARSK